MWNRLSDSHHRTYTNNDEPANYDDSEMFVPVPDETPQVLLVGAEQDRRHPVVHENVRTIFRLTENLSVREHPHNMS